MKNTIPTLTFDCWGDTVTVVPELGRYGNGRLAISFSDDDGPFDTATVNMPDHPIGVGEVFVKTYSETQPLVEAMFAAGWIEHAGRSAQSGFVNIPAVRLVGDFAAWVAQSEV
jgi:hypothetical protein